MNMDYAPPGFVTLDNARAIYYFARVDLSSRFDMAYRGYKENIDIVTMTLAAKIDGKIPDDVGYEKLRKEKIRAIFQHPIEVFARNAVDIMMRVYHPLLFTTEKIEPSRAFKPIYNPKEYLWDHCGYKMISFSGLFSKLSKIDDELPGYELPIEPNHILSYFRGHLSAGALKAFLLLNDGNIKEVPYFFWNTDVGGEIVYSNTTAFVNIDGTIQVGRIIIDARSIVDVYYKMANQIDNTLRAEHREGFDWSKNYNENGVEYIKEIISQGEVISQSAKILAIEKKAGAPERYDKEVFMWEALKYVYYVTGKVPPSQKEHAEKTMARYESIIGKNVFPKKENGDYEDSRWARGEISSLWKKMDFNANYKLPET